MRIRTQFSLMTGCLIAAVVTSIAVSVTRAERTIIEGESSERLTALTEGVVRLGQEALEGRDPLMLLSYLMFLQQERPELAMAAVTRRGHTSTIGSDGPGLAYWSRMVSEPRPVKYTVTAPTGGGSVAVSSAAVSVTVAGTAFVKVEEARPAEFVVLKLGFRKDKLDEEVDRALRPLIERTVAIAGLFMLGGMLGAMTLAQHLTSPLLALSGAAASISEGRLDVQVPVKGSTEVASLARKFNDMTARLRELVSFREDILHTLTHELNTPLGGLKAHLELWQEGGLPAEPARGEALAAMASTVSRMEHSLQNALRLFKSTARALEGERKLVWVEELFRDACRVFAASAKSKGVEVRALPDETSECLYCDEELLRQIVVNLVSNSIKYTPAGGRVTLSLESDEREVRFAVADTGPGIRPEDLPHLFTKFFRADSQERIPGTGLGLSIAHRAAQALGGRIDVHSEVGKGTTFRVAIPKPQPEEVEA